VAAVASSLGPGSEFSFAGFTEAESRGLCDLADAACEDRRSSAVGLFKRLLCVRSVSGDGPALGTYREMARVLVRECEELGLQVRCREFVAGKPVVLASWPGSEPALEAVLFTSHYDVVPAEQGASWGAAIAGLIACGRGSEMDGGRVVGAGGGRQGVRQGRAGHEVCAGGPARGHPWRQGPRHHAQAHAVCSLRPRLCSPAGGLTLPAAAI
jgi:hypothetical protein